MLSEIKLEKEIRKTYNDRNLYETVLDSAMRYTKEDNIEDIADNIIEDVLFYTDDIWVFMKFYQDPESANYTKMIDCLYNDIYKILKKCEIQAR